MHCYFSNLREEWEDEDLKKRLLFLPQALRDGVIKYENRRDRQLVTAGKLLLLQMLKDLQLKDNLSLDDLEYNPSGKPFFNSDFSFNIAHSGAIVACVGVLNGNIGIDVEQIVRVDIAPFEPFFTREEWRTIHGAEDKAAMFYELWVRKEAILKASGDADFPLSSVDVHNDIVSYKNVTYYLHDIFVGDGYKGCIACDRRVGEMQLVERIV